MNNNRFMNNRISNHLWDCHEEFISAPKINRFWPNPPPGNEKLDLLSNPIPEPEYPYLSISAFLVKVTAPNKQFFSVGSLKLD